MEGIEAVAAAGWGAALACVVVTLLMLRRRAELIARACHELAGPLNAAGLALHTATREVAAPRLAAVDLELRRAGRALEDLDAARAGRRARDRHATVDVGCLLAQQALAWQPFARANGCELRVAAPSGLVVTGDPVRIAQAVGNLLANAIEHGGGRIALRAERAAGGVRIEVTDEGAGLDRVTFKPNGRRGRGLTIATEIAERHGGRLTAVPSAKGARVVIDLPAAPPRTAVAAAAAPETPLSAA